MDTMWLMVTLLDPSRAGAGRGQRVDILGFVGQMISCNYSALPL